MRKYLYDKKVLLRERKRHTDRGVSSTPSVTRGGVPPWQGYPLARSDGGYLRWGTPRPGGVPPPAGPGWGTPHWTWLGYPPQSDLAGVPPTPPHQTWLGYPPPQVWTDRRMDKHVSKHNLPVVLRTRSVMIKIVFASNQIFVDCSQQSAFCLGLFFFFFFLLYRFN